MRVKFINAATMGMAFGFLFPVLAFETPGVPTARAFHSRVVTKVAPSTTLWVDRGSGPALDVFHGAGGRQHSPRGTFTFVEEIRSGTAPKFKVMDGDGVEWIAKLGEEVQSETAASRLVWAAGYYTDEDYYLPELRVVKLVKLSRGGNAVQKDGTVKRVRLERMAGQKRIDTWSWFHNEHSRTKEMSGLRILMALMNNWDLKKVNNSITQAPGDRPHYVVTDLGATFGRTGNTFIRSKNNLQEYRGSKFIQHVDSEQVDFHLNSRPFFLTIFHLPNYVARTKMQSVVKDIPRDHAKWLGETLGRLSTDQIRDCFRAAGYTPDEVDAFAGVVLSRIAELRRL